MSEPWYDPNLYAWLPGTVLGTLGGLWGALCGVLVPQGRGRGVVWGLFWVLMAAGVGCLVAGLYGLADGQPFHVWMWLLFPGVQVPLLLGILGGVVVRKGYRDAELRRMQAENL